MSKEIIHVIEQISREKGVPKDVLLGAIKSALLSAARKKYDGRENVELDLDEGDFTIRLYEVKVVTDDVEDKDFEITPEDAQQYNAGAVEGDEVEVELPFQDFGRIAAQTAKQVIFQRVREAERDVIFNDFKDKVGQIISGTVMRKEKGVYYVNIGKTDAVLPVRDTLSGENLRRGDLVRAYIEEIRTTSKGPAIIISRSNPNFVSELFKMEVPEISEGLVIIKDVVRVPGERTKIAVYSTTPSVDPVGACVGMKGTRVQSIVRELRGERIDIIPWTEDLRMLIARALSPATIERVGIVEDEKTAMVVVADDNLSVAIGKRGQNVKLAMKLTGWAIDIISETEYSKIKMQEAEDAFDGGPVMVDGTGKPDTEDTNAEATGGPDAGSENEAGSNVDADADLKADDTVEEVAGDPDDVVEEGTSAPEADAASDTEDND